MVLSSECEAEMKIGFIFDWLDMAG
jgi:hypothetical protein